MGIREGAEAPFLMCLTLSTMYIMLRLMETASLFRLFHWPRALQMSTDGTPTSASFEVDYVWRIE